MVREMAAVLRGAAVWELSRLQFHIDEKTVMLILTGDNRELDRFALLHLKDYMDRKYAKKAIIICQDDETYGQVKGMALTEGIHTRKWSKRKVQKLYRFYSFYLFSDKIVFTYLDNPKDNLLGRLLRETPVEEEEVVCLGLYRLRRVPGREGGLSEGQGLCGMS